MLTLAAASRKSLASSEYEVEYGSDSCSCRSIMEEFAECLQRVYLLLAIFSPYLHRDYPYRSKSCFQVVGGSGVAVLGCFTFWKL
jgi:hypothetical protein